MKIRGTKKLEFKKQTIIELDASQMQSINGGLNNITGPPTARPWTNQDRPTTTGLCRTVSGIPYFEG